MQEVTLPFMLPDAGVITRHLESKRLAIKSIALKGDLEVITSTQELYGGHMILGKYPNLIRAELSGPFGQPVLTLVCDGSFITALDLSENKAYTGPATRRNLARFLGISLSTEEIYALLCGTVPLAGYREPKTLASHQGDLLIRGGVGGSEDSLSLMVDPENMAIKQAWLSKAGQPQDWDKARLKIRFSEFEEKGAFRLPAKLWVADDKNRRLTLSHDEVHVNLDLEPNLFRLDIPRTFPIQVLP